MFLVNWLYLKIVICDDLKLSGILYIQFNYTQYFQNILINTKLTIIKLDVLCTILLIDSVINYYIISR